MFKITVVSDEFGKTASFDKKILLSEALEQMGILQNKPCGGKGICQKCRVIANGQEVLSCQTYVDTDTYVKYTISKGDVQGLAEGFMADFDINPIIEKGLGMAIDIGTTTIAANLYKLPECEKIKSMAVSNLQAVYGADVISRIEYSNSGGLQKLQDTVRKQIEEFGESAASKIEGYVITGNTTMLHLLTGKDPASIAVAPFTPQSLFGKWYKNAFIPKCISAYVGADITCAILSSGMLERKTSFLLDVGTNGEMALWHKGKLVCCSTAAGPALEGGGISQGTLALDGAINKVYIENGEIKYTTIGDAPPVGICGTGIIDAISCMKKTGVLDETGYLQEDFMIGDSNVYITAKDVRQVQLAKAAIRAGIDTLIHDCGINCDEIECFYIAGGFGSFINIESACEIGLIPKEVSEKAVAIGNAALSGAKMILLSKSNLEKSEHIATSAEVVELSSNNYFMEKYMDSMFI